MTRTPANRRTTGAGVCLLLAAALLPACHRAEVADRTARLATTGGTLELTLPGGYDVSEFDAGLGPEIPAVAATPSGSVEHRFTVALLGRASMMPGFGSDEWLREELDRWMRLVQGRTVEAEFETRESVESDAHGFYLTATDAEPGPNGFRRLVKGYFRLGDGVVSLELLHNLGEREGEDLFLARQRDLRWTPAAGPG